MEGFGMPAGLRRAINGGLPDLNGGGPDAAGARMRRQPEAWDFQVGKPGAWN